MISCKRGKWTLKKINWHMQEVLAFQEGLAQPEKLENVEVTPRFSIETVEGRPKLSGIYHLAVQYEADLSHTTAIEHEEAIVIDEVELNEATGYFEYALPFHIDFPPEANTPVQFKIDQVQATLTDDKHVEVSWEVICQYEVQGIEKELQTLATETNSVEATRQEKQEGKAEKVETETPVEKEVPKVAQSTEAVGPVAQKEVVEKEPQVVAENLENETAKQPVKERSSEQIPAFFQQLKDGTSTKSFIR